MSPERIVFSESDGYLPDGWDFVDGDHYVSECLRSIWLVCGKGNKERRTQLKVTQTDQALDCPHLCISRDGPICNFRGTMFLKNSQHIHEYCVIFSLLEEES